MYCEIEIFGTEAFGSQQTFIHKEARFLNNLLPFKRWSSTSIKQLPNTHLDINGACWLVNNVYQQY